VNKSALALALLAALSACADKERAEAFCKGILDASDGCVERQYTMYKEQQAAEEQAAEEAGKAAEAGGGDGAAKDASGAKSLSEELVKDVQKSCEDSGGKFTKGVGGMGAGCLMGGQ
jgi:hypothetical protein